MKIHRLPFAVGMATVVLAVVVFTTASMIVAEETPVQQHYRDQESVFALVAICIGILLMYVSFSFPADPTPLNSQTENSR